MKFSDGVSFDTTGELRIQWRPDGLYVVGRGMLIPVNSKEEGRELISKLNSDTSKRGLDE
jgi:hypothetical protein